MIRKLLCWLGKHEFMDCCDYCERFIDNADCAKCSYFLFRKKVCKHCEKLKNDSINRR